MLKALLVCGLACSCVSSPRLIAQTVTAAQVTKEQWHEDLKFLAAELPRRHANAFHFMSRTAFEHEVRQLDRSLDELNRDEIFVGMDRIANAIGDGHTYIRVPADAPIFPVHFERFGQDYRLVSSQDIPGARDALGGQLLKIGGMPIAQAEQLLLALTPADETPALRRVRTTALINDGMVLNGLRITPERNTVRYVVRTEGGRDVALEYHGQANQFRGAEITDILETGWLRPVPHPALYLQQPDKTFWCTYLPASKTGYCDFRSYDDLNRTARTLTELIKHHHPENLVIDLRLNAGGDFDEGLKYVVNPIRRMTTINRPGHLFVLIGPRTFSAAMANAAHFRQRTKAILVGQPIGEKPNSYQEAREMVLPNSRWIVRYSVRFYRFVSGRENLIRPDREIVETWADFRSGRDPVMDWVLRSVERQHPSSSTVSFRGRRRLARSWIDQVAGRRSRVWEERLVGGADAEIGKPAIGATIGRPVQGVQAAAMGGQDTVLMTEFARDVPVVAVGGQVAVPTNEAEVLHGGIAVLGGARLAAQRQAPELLSQDDVDDSRDGIRGRCVAWTSIMSPTTELVRRGNHVLLELAIRQRVRDDVKFHLREDHVISTHQHATALARRAYFE